MISTSLFNYDCREENRTNHQTSYIMALNIPDFKWLLNNQTNREISTKDAPFEKLANFMFQFKFKFLGLNNDLIEIYYQSQSTVYVVEASCENVSRSEKIVNKHNFLVEDRVWHLFVVQYKDYLNAYDNLNLKFVFTVRLDNPTKRLPNILPAKEEFYETEPKKDIAESQLIDPAFTDVIIQSEDDEEIPAHKIYLVSNSVVFKAHFQHKTKENITNVVKVPFETAVVKDLLSYIYTDEVPNIKTTARSLLKAADFYEIDELKVLCEETLVKQLSKRNAVETLMLACLHRAELLKRASLEYIIEGDKAKEIVQTEAWKTLQIAEVAKSLFEFNLTNQ